MAGVEKSYTLQSTGDLEGIQPFAQVTRYVHLGGVPPELMRDTGDSGPGDVRLYDGGVPGSDT